MRWSLIAVLCAGLIACKKEEAKPAPVVVPAEEKPKVDVPAPAPKDPKAAERDAAFWAWTSEHLAELKAVANDETELTAAFDDEVNKVAEGLTFELGIGKKPFEIVISADGEKKLFPVVKRLVAAAPALPDTKIIAFRPRKDMADFGIKFGDVELEAKDITFKAQPDDERPGLFAIELFVKGLTKDNLEVLREPAFMLLEASVGEYDTETKIGNVEISPAPAKPDASQQPLSALPKWLDAQ